jgi:hypothetical protein
VYSINPMAVARYLLRLRPIGLSGERPYGERPVLVGQTSVHNFSAFPEAPTATSPTPSTTTPSRDARQPTAPRSSTTVRISPSRS